MQGDNRKDARAAQIIQQFAKRLRKLGGGQVPDRWQRLATEELTKVPLSDFIRSFYPRPRRGRPRSRSDDHNARLVKTIDQVKAELLPRSKSGTVSDRAALRHWIKTSGSSTPEYELKSVVMWLSKDLSRARPPGSRRPKRKKSQKSR